MYALVDLWEGWGGSYFTVRLIQNFVLFAKWLLKTAWKHVLMAYDCERNDFRFKAAILEVNKMRFNACQLPMAVLLEWNLHLACVNGLNDPRVS